MKLSAYNFFVVIGSIFFCIPAQMQLPFRVLALILFNILIIKHYPIKLSLALIIIIICIYSLLKIKNDTFDPSLFIVLLSIIPVFYFSKLKINYPYKKIKKILSVWLCFLVFQLLIFRYNGRPTLSYEINHSASYLFLFYLLCRILKYKLGSIFVICASLLILSRLLILCIVLYELFNFVIPKHRSLFKNLSYSNIVLSAFVFISIFSIWYFLNMTGNIVEGSDEPSRLSNINDTSNFLRFKINTNIIWDLFESENSKMLFYSGYGDLGVNPIYRAQYFLMPHNEILKSIAQFGLIFTILCFLISRKGYLKLIDVYSLPIFVSIVIYTLILWERFTVVPSLEMIFILFILTLKRKIYESQSTN